MINYMINFANNFEADCRDGFVSNDEAYTEKAIEGVDLDKKLKKWCKENQYKFRKIDYVDLLVRFVRCYGMIEPSDMIAYTIIYANQKEYKKMFKWLKKIDKWDSDFLTPNQKKYIK